MNSYIHELYIYTYKISSLVLKHLCGYALINITPHYPLPSDVREELGIWIMQNSNVLPIGQASQSNHNLPHTKKMGIYEGICLLMVTLLYMRMVSG